MRSSTPPTPKKRNKSIRFYDPEHHQTQKRNTEESGFHWDWDVDLGLNEGLEKQGQKQHQEEQEKLLQKCCAFELTPLPPPLFPSTLPFSPPPTLASQSSTSSATTWSVSLFDGYVELGDLF
jgi:hypothetical protein